MRHTQVVHELCIPLSIELVVEPRRITVRAWELVDHFNVGVATGRRYFGDVQLFGAPSRSSTSHRQGHPVAVAQVINGRRFGFIDDICLDQDFILSRPRMYGDTWSDFGAWMFILTTDTWRFLTPFNRHFETIASKADSEGFTSMSAAMTKARMQHLVIASILVPWASNNVGESSIVRLNASPHAQRWLNVEVSDEIQYDDPAKIMPGHPKTIERLHSFLPRLSVDEVAPAAPGESITFVVRCTDRVDATLLVEPVSGYAPKTRAQMQDGVAHVKACALGLESGDVIDFKFGLGPVAGLARGICLVK